MLPGFNRLNCNARFLKLYLYFAYFYFFFSFLIHTMTIPLEILHFNDVYHVSPAKDEPVGGASRFVSKINQTLAESSEKPLVLFSGDAFNPSLEGSITRGAHV